MGQSLTQHLPILYPKMHPKNKITKKKREKKYRIQTNILEDWNAAVDKHYEIDVSDSHAISAALKRDTKWLNTHTQIIGENEEDE